MTKEELLKTLELFAFSHLPPELQAASKPFYSLALVIVDTVPDNRERDKSLDALLVAKDAAVRARKIG